MDRALGYRVNHRLYLQLFRRFVPIKQRLMTVVSLTFILLSHINYFVKGKAHNITYLIASHYYWSLLGNVSKMMVIAPEANQVALKRKIQIKAKGFVRNRLELWFSVLFANDVFIMMNPVGVTVPLTCSGVTVPLTCF